MNIISYAIIDVYEVHMSYHGGRWTRVGVFSTQQLAKKEVNRLGKHHRWTRINDAPAIRTTDGRVFVLQSKEPVTLDESSLVQRKLKLESTLEKLSDEEQTLLREHFRRGGD